MRHEDIPSALSLTYGDMTPWAKNDMPRMFGKEELKPQYFLATKQQEIVGVIAIQALENSNRIWGLSCLFVAKEHQHKKVATLLIDGAIATMRKAGAHLIKISTDEDLVPFWEKFHFTKIQELANNGMEMALRI